MICVRQLNHPIEFAEPANLAPAIPAAQQLRGCASPLQLHSALLARRCRREKYASISHTLVLALNRFLHRMHFELTAPFCASVDAPNRTPGESADPFLGLLYPTEDYKVYGWVIAPAMQTTLTFMLCKNGELEMVSGWLHMVTLICWLTNCRFITNTKIKLVLVVDNGSTPRDEELLRQVRYLSAIPMPIKIRC